MRSFNVLVLGDGPHELGHDWEHLLEPDSLPALPGLIHRLLGSPPGAMYDCRLLRRVQHTRGKGPTATKKVIAAVTIARQTGFDAVAILVDRDRARTTDKLRPLLAGRDKAETAGGPPCAVGVAVETFDAWMIVDTNAVARAGGNQAQCHPDPESLSGREGTGDHPKDVAG